MVNKKGSVKLQLTLSIMSRSFWQSKYTTKN